MRRRDFIAGLGAAAWPVAARAQQRAIPTIELQTARTLGINLPSSVLAIADEIIE